MGLASRGCGPPVTVPWVARAAPYLAQTDGVVEGLSPRVEVHCLSHLLLALILPRQVVGCSPVSSLIGYFSSLERYQRDPGDSGSGSFSPVPPPSLPRPDSWNAPYLLNVALEAMNAD